MPSRTRIGKAAAAGFVAAALGAVLLPPQGEAQEAGLPLAEAIRNALENNLLLRAARQQGRVAEAHRSQARAAWLPRIDAEETFSETNNPTLVFSSLLNQERFRQRDFDVHSLNHPSSLTNFNTRVRIEQALFTGGKLLAGSAAARAGDEAALGQQERADQEIVLQVKRAFYGALLARESLATVDAALAAARQHVTTAEALVAKGMAVRSDVLRAEVLAGTLERQRIDAGNDSLTARRRLAYVMGIPFDSTLDEKDAWPETAPPASVEETTEQALKRRPDLRALEHQQQAAEAAARQARGDYLPSVGVVGQYDLNSKELDRQADSYAVLVGAKWNLFNGLGTRAKVEEAVALAERARLLREDLAARVRVEVEEAWRGVVTADGQARVTERASAQARENLSIVRDRFGSGLSRRVDVLDAVATREQTELEHLQARVNRQLRRAELDLATGAPIAGNRREKP